MTNQTYKLNKRRIKQARLINLSYNNSVKH